MLRRRWTRSSCASCTFACDSPIEVDRGVQEARRTVNGPSRCSVILSQWGSRRMGLPGAEKAEIIQDKIVRYLLSTTHRAGRSKAAFFGKHGFKTQDWQALAEALRRHAAENVATLVEETRYGTRYVIDGALVAPDCSSQPRLGCVHVTRCCKPLSDCCDARRRPKRRHNLDGKHLE